MIILTPLISPIVVDRLPAMMQRSLLLLKTRSYPHLYNKHHTKMIYLKGVNPHMNCCDEQLIKCPTENTQPTQSSKYEDDRFYYAQPSFEKNFSHDIVFFLSPPSPTSTDNIIILNNNNNYNQNNIRYNINDNGDSFININDYITLNESFEKEVRIYSHKTMILNGSDYFKKLLNEVSVDTTEIEIAIPNVSVNVFFQVLMFLYTSTLTIEIDTLNEIFLVCDEFQLENAKEICIDFVRSIENKVLENFLFDQKKTICPELYSYIVDQAVENSTYFLQVNRVHKLSKDVLFLILKSDGVYLKEIEIFNSVLVWIRANIEGVKIERIVDSDIYGTSENNNNNYNNNNKIVRTQLEEIFQFIRFPLMSYEDLISGVEPYHIIPDRLLLEAYRYISMKAHSKLPRSSIIISNHRLKNRNITTLQPGIDVFSIVCRSHKCCSSVLWPINNFKSIRTHKHVSNTFTMFGLQWKLWAYPAGETKHPGSISVYLEAVRVCGKESFDFLRKITFFFSLVNQHNISYSKHYPSSPNILFNNHRSVWGIGLIDLNSLYNPELGYLDNGTVCIELHILKCYSIKR
ncbi:hypothetical protein PPL_04723 [Heterostelium album PN500]|uniref:BTB domain-containing protein n=1 Tax=Heterostelium pallidum (strain ATCC 26659 / Pp 5 / PN500) TaxID=670386 RepID=D3B8D1_HETP5|nr:hypothetical protein PPL_04723 [Heterostelium album PN500]EFA82299.1 hypothetical protein PPL_04723 [Heterostelium album PN500]|eukprot:XP_020434416.1 hypothetical protein PPL_04723 [Heterostelium album PN500]